MNKKPEDCPSCGGLNTSCPAGCGRDPATGELNGSTLGFDEDHSPVETPGRRGSIKRSHRAEGRNWVD